MTVVLLSYAAALIILASARSRQLSDLTATNLMNSRLRQGGARHYLSVKSNCSVDYILDLANDLVSLVVPGKYLNRILKEK
jgi:hypothetical protein